MTEADDQHEEQGLRSLSHPRDVSPSERALLVALADRVGRHELTAQVEQATVVATCACGCPSIGVRSDDAPALQPEAMRALSGTGRDDVAAIAATARDAAGREVDVILHVVEGRIEELEVWAGTWGGDPRTALPDPAALRFER